MNVVVVKAAVSQNWPTSQYAPAVVQRASFHQGGRVPQRGPLEVRARGFAAEPRRRRGCREPDQECFEYAHEDVKMTVVAAKAAVSQTWQALQFAPADAQ